ncbi:MAG: hypothetical protein DMG58_25685 [Acidobacteria bacterium]|nr:MAG: hypothetical protein DMG58_25685 [Acidobacteriota bacterium]
MCVSWYTRFKLSLRDLAIMMADRGHLVKKFEGLMMQVIMDARHEAQQVAAPADVRVGSS